MKKKLWIIILFIIVIIFSLWKTFAKPNLSTAPVLYYSISCSHCKDLEEYIKANNIKDKFNFEEKEVSQNRQNNNDLVQAAKTCGLTTTNIAIPFFYDEGKCYVGTDEITKYLLEKIKN